MLLDENRGSITVLLKASNWVIKLHTVWKNTKSIYCTQMHYLCICMFLFFYYWMFVLSCLRDNISTLCVYFYFSTSLMQYIVYNMNICHLSLLEDIRLNVKRSGWMWLALSHTTDKHFPMDSASHLLNNDSEALIWEGIYKIRLDFNQKDYNNNTKTLVMVSFGYTNQSCERCFTPMAGTLRIQMHTLNSLPEQGVG